MLRCSPRPVHIIMGCCATEAVSRRSQGGASGGIGSSGGRSAFAVVVEGSLQYINSGCHHAVGGCIHTESTRGSMQRVERQAEPSCEESHGA